MDAFQRSTTFRIEQSAIDEQRFGVRTTRAMLVTAQDLQSALIFCAEHNTALLIARCPTEQLALVHSMEQAGFLLMDTLVYFVFDLTRKALPDTSGQITIRYAQPDDASAVEALARESFVGYFGHYHADSRLDSAAADEAYVSWACTSVEAGTDRDGAAPVFVAEQDNVLMGFATLRVNSPAEGEGVLFGVSPQWQGRGIYRSFMLHFLNWCQYRGMSRAVVSTQITNLAVQRVWTRLGFEPLLACYTFHKWF